MRLLEFTSRLFEYYIIAMLTICSILLAILVFSFGRHNLISNDLVDQLSRLELIEETQ